MDRLPGVISAGGSRDTNKTKKRKSPASDVPTPARTAKRPKAGEIVPVELSVTQQQALDALAEGYGRFVYETLFSDRKLCGPHQAIVPSAEHAEFFSIVLDPKYAHIRAVFLTGIPGAGKSTALDILTRVMLHCRAQEELRRDFRLRAKVAMERAEAVIVSVATTGAAAVRLGDKAQTLHKFVALKKPGTFTEFGGVRDKADIREDAIDRLAAVRFLFLDEVSMLDPAGLDNLYAVMNLVNGCPFVRRKFDKNFDTVHRAHTCSTTLPKFGLLNKLVFVGDFFQLQPAGDTRSNASKAMSRNTHVYDDWLWQLMAGYSDEHLRDGDLELVNDPDGGAEKVVTVVTRTVDANVPRNMAMVCLRTSHRLNKNQDEFSQMLNKIRMSETESLAEQFGTMVCDYATLVDRRCERRYPDWSNIGQVERNRIRQEERKRVTALFPTNRLVDRFNDEMLDTLPGAEHCYVSTLLYSPMSADALTKRLLLATLELAPPPVPSGGQRIAPSVNSAPVFVPRAWYHNLWCNIRSLAWHVPFAVPLDPTDRSSFDKGILQQAAKDLATSGVHVAEPLSPATCALPLLCDVSTLQTSRLLDRCLSAKPTGTAPLVLRLKEGCRVSFTDNVHAKIANGTEGTVEGFYTVSQFMTFKSSKQLANGMIINSSNTLERAKHRFEPGDEEVPKTLGDFYRTTFREPTPEIGSEGRLMFCGTHHAVTSKVSREIDIEYYPCILVDTQDGSPLRVLLLPIVRPFLPANPTAVTTTGELVNGAAAKYDTSTNVARRINLASTLPGAPGSSAAYSHQRKTRDASSPNFVCLRMPVKQCDSKTAHRVQGSTLDAVWIGIPDPSANGAPPSMEAGMMYVCASRVRNKDDVAFSADPSSCISTNPRTIRFQSVQDEIIACQTFE